LRYASKLCHFVLLLLDHTSHCRNQTIDPVDLVEGFVIGNHLNSIVSIANALRRDRPDDARPENRKPDAWVMLAFLMPMYSPIRRRGWKDSDHFVCGWIDRREAGARVAADQCSTPVHDATSRSSSR
jgi:hypothetical protein